MPPASARHPVGLTAARNAKAGLDLHTNSVADMARPLRFYASDQAHNCHQKAMNLLGLSGKSLAKVRSDANFRMDTGALQQMITVVRAHGAQHRYGLVGKSVSACRHHVPAQYGHGTRSYRYT